MKQIISIKALLLTVLMTTVVGNVWGNDKYVKVTSSDDLDDGDECIIAAVKNGVTYIAVTSNETTQLAAANSGFNVNGNTITVTMASPIVFTLGKSSDIYTLKVGNKYLYYQGDNNLGINTSGNIPKTDSKFWIHKTNAQDEYVLFNKYNENMYIGMNNACTYFKAYTGPSSQTYAIGSLYKKQTTATVTLSSGCTDGTRYYGTYSNASAFVVPGDLTVSAVGVDSEGKLEVMDYNTGDVVKANTGVMVSSTTSGDHSVTLSSAEGTEISGNLLMASGDGGITAVQMAGAKSGIKYYRLTMHNGSDIGFWWGNADGAAFDLGANKAYLAVPETTKVREGFRFFDNENSGIAEIEDRKVGNEIIYDLQGRRVSKATKGVYIVNGRIVTK